MKKKRWLIAGTKVEIPAFWKKMALSLRDEIILLLLIIIMILITKL